MTDEARGLVVKLMELDPSKRLAAGEALKHSWIFTPESASKIHRQETILGLKSFNARRKLKGAVISTMLSNQLIRALGVQKEAQLFPSPKTGPTTELVFSEDRVPLNNHPKEV